MATLTNPSERTIAERQGLANQMDDFTTFRWANVDMFEEFGAFIINEKKGSLKMYNGASFTNTYTKQQYQDGYTNLAGVSFNTQQISFTIGVYWISIEDYRVLMNVLHPYELGMLSFSFEKKYGYKCKLSNIKDSTRYVVGKEKVVTTTDNTNLRYSHKEGANGDGYRYYTELNLTFDVIGKQCARQIVPTIVEFNGNPNADLNDTAHIIETNNSDWSSCWPSDLDFPITIRCNNYFVTNNSPVQLKAMAYILKDGVEITEPITLFSLGLQNLQISSTSTEPSIDATRLSFTYDSEQGLIYWVLGNKEQLLSLLSINAEGKRIVNAMQVNRFYWPGRLTYPETLDNTYTFEIRIIDVNKNINMASTTCEMSSRTNII